MPRLFILLASAIAASFILPEIKTLRVDQSPVKKEYNHPRKLNDTTFLLKGKITGQKKGYIKLIYTDKNGEYILDSSAIKKGHFQFRGHIAEPTMVFMEGTMPSKDMNDPNFTSFFLEPGDIKIDLVFNDFKNAVITGSKTQDEHVEFNKLMAPALKEMEPLSKAYEKAAKEYREALKAK